MRKLSAWLVAAALVASMTACQDDGDPPDDGFIEYVALGDSHTAAPRTPETGLSVPCFRSDQNYPHLIAEALPRIRLLDVSCSGANSDAMADGETSRGTPVPPQLDALSEGTDLVTVNIGGNDDGLFSTWASECRELAVSDPEGSPCADANRTPDGDALLDLVPGIKDNISAVLDEIKDRSPDAQVIVVTYPRAFPETGTCDFAAAFAEGDHAYINSLVETLGDAMIEAAKEAGVDWVDVYRASRGHDICSKEPWTNGNDNDPTRANWLHPFPEEQAAVARLVMEKL
jgi:lysophospholipase L1-like esterase